jgi:uncharacterized protein involved in type VI secretion and phage assembly
MSLMEPMAIDLLLEEEILRPPGRWFGVFPALVTDIRDPDGQGRVKISLPWSPDSGGSRYEAWARLATLMAGGDRGTWLIPDTGDEVLVSFQAGDPRWPFVLGGLWNGKDAPPQAMDGSGNNEIKVIRSRNGVKVTLDDTDGTERLQIETPGGQKVTLRDGPGVVEIVDSNGNSVKLASAGITVTSSAKVTINASTAEITAGMLTVNAGMSTFSGVVKADTVITNSVVSTSYTPGAGNIW